MESKFIKSANLLDNIAVLSEVLFAWLGRTKQRFANALEDCHYLWSKQQTPLPSVPNLPSLALP